MKKYLKLFASFAMTFLIAFLGSSVTTPGVDTWYQTINKPIFNPPNWIFAPVWTLLYILMAIAFYLVWTNKGFKKIHFKLYVNQLLLNYLWSFMFFFLQKPLWAFINIVLLIAFVAVMCNLFYKVNKTAGYLILPYLLWISFASVLNFAIVLLN